MWLIRIITKFIIPTALILLFSLFCMMFVWNHNSFTTNPFSNIREAWFNIQPNGYILTPQGILGKAITDNDAIARIYTNYNTTVQNAQQIQGGSTTPILPTNIFGWFQSDFAKVGGVMFIMPVAVSLLFGIVTYTIFSILFHILLKFIKKSKKNQQNKESK